MRSVINSVRFHALAAPTADEVTEVASRTAERVQKVLARHGRTIDGTGERDAVEPLGEQLALAALCGAAAAGHGLAGDGAGEPLLRVVDLDARPQDRARGRERRHQRTRRGRRPTARPRSARALCRYVCRPPIAQERLEETANGKLRYSLKKAWRDGTVALVLEPLDLLARVCALISPPGPAIPCGQP